MTQLSTKTLINWKSANLELSERKTEHIPLSTVQHQISKQKRIRVSQTTGWISQESIGSNQAFPIVCRGLATARSENRLQAQMLVGDNQHVQS